MKTINIPASDCASFVAGILTDDTIREFREGAETEGASLPRYGVVIWYEDVERVKSALLTLTSGDCK